MATVRLTIDGKAVEVHEGGSALDALRAAGLEVPTACHDPRLKPTGSCRFCLVGLKGSSRPVTACALPATEGMEIFVDTPELNEARKANVALLAKEYPAEYVEEFPEKSFHHWVKHFGLDCASRNGRLIQDVDSTNPYFRFDPAACIKCFRCVRICSEVQGSFVWNVFERSGETHVAPDSLGSLVDSTCKSCGACVDACPTGALVDKTREEAGAPTAWTRTTCPYCGVGCELSVGTKDERIVQVLPVLDAPVNKGHLCVKGRYAYGYVHAPDRVTSPMVRKEGRLVPVSWPEALRAAADGFRSALGSYGTGSVGVLGSARATNEDNYLSQKFARVVLGTNNVDCCARVCHGPTAAAMKAMLGTGAATNSYDDLDLATTVMVVGSNPLENHPIVGDRILQAKLAGANLIVIDPRRTEIARYADIHLALRPGTNVPLLNAMANVMVTEGLTDPGFLATRVDEVEEYVSFVRDWTPERAAEICGVKADDIRAAARTYATAKPSMCFHGLGVTEHLQGTEGVMTLVNLALLTGNMGRPGCGINPLRGQNNVQGSAHMGCEPGSLTGYVPIAGAKALFEQVWNAAVPDEPGMNLLQMLDAAEEGRFKALWVIGYDVYYTNPIADRTRRAFEGMEMVIVQDLFLNETAKEFAHVFLPACSSFEHDGTFMNAERRVQRVRKAIEPIGESKADWEIVQLMAAEMGKPEGFTFSSVEEVWEEVRKVWKPGAGMAWSRLEQQGLQWPCPTEDHPGTRILHAESFPIGVKAALKRIDFVPTPEQPDGEYPFVLNTGRTLVHFNAGTMTARTKNSEIRPSDTLDMNPVDAARLGLQDGSRAKVRSPYGEAVLPVRRDPGVREGELFATFHTVEVFINRLTNPVRDRVFDTPSYKVTAVAVESAD